MDELYVLARRVLLDALYALGLHRDAVIVVGAHAVYMRVDDADLAVAPHTTDGDLAIEPAALGETPPLEQAFTHAGFLPRRGDSVGVWVTHRPTSASTTTEFLITHNSHPDSDTMGHWLPGIAGFQPAASSRKRRYEHRLRAGSPRSQEDRGPGKPTGPG